MRFGQRQSKKSDSLWAQRGYARCGVDCRRDRRSGLDLADRVALLGRPDIQSQKSRGIPPDTLFRASKLALTIVAGIGAVVALVVAFRRQRLNEAEHVRQDRATARDETPHARAVPRSPRAHTMTRAPRSAACPLPQGGLAWGLVGTAAA